MTFTTTGSPFSSHFGTAPRPLLWLIGVTSFLSLSAGLFDRLLTSYMGTLGPHQLFGLSWGGLLSGYIWQPLSYLFLHHGMGGLSLGFLIELVFHMYLLYMMGSAVMSHFGTKPFFALYFGSGLMAAGAALATSSALGHGFLLLGAGPALYGIMATWAILYPGLEMTLLFGIRCTSRALFLGLLLFALLVDLSQGQFVSMAAYFAGTLTAYLATIIAWDFRGPFEQTHRVDAAVASLGSGVRARRQRTQEMMMSAYKKAKVFDFETGEAILDDEEFVDAMLSKISEYGENSLTRKERKRMRQISKQKAKSR